MKAKPWTPEMQAEIRRVFSYDPATGIVSRVVQRGRWMPGPLGKPKHGPYKQAHITAGGKRHSLYIHRIAFFLHTGEQPDEVDHRDLDKTNNRASNLRAATHSQNGMNRRPTRTLPVGVSVKRRNGRTFYRAHITINNRQITTDRKTLLRAAAWRKAKEAVLFKEFAPQSP